MGRFADLASGATPPIDSGGTQIVDPNPPPDMPQQPTIMPQEKPSAGIPTAGRFADLAYPEQLQQEAQGLTKRFGKQLWNETIAKTVHSLVGDPETEGMKFHAAEAMRELTKGKKISDEAYEEVYKDLIKEMQLPPEQRETPELKKYRQYKPTGKAPMGFDMPQAETIGQKAVDITAGITGFIAQLALTRKILPKGTPEPIIWETQSLANGGKPGEGSSMYALFGTFGKAGEALASKVPGKGLVSKAARFAVKPAPASAAFGTQAALRGESAEDVAIAAGIPYGFAAAGAAKQAFKTVTKASKTAQDARTPKGATQTTPKAKKPQKPLETIEYVAVKLPNGEIIKGNTHPEIYEKAGLLSVHFGEKSVPKGLKDGFVTNTGRFVGRNEAAKIAKRAKQISEATKSKLELEAREFNKANPNKAKEVFPQRNKETNPLKSSAIKLPDGKIIDTKGSTWSTYKELGWVKGKKAIVPKGTILGIIDKSNKFWPERYANVEEQIKAEKKLYEPKPQSLYEKMATKEQIDTDIAKKATRPQSIKEINKILIDQLKTSKKLQASEAKPAVAKLRAIQAAKGEKILKTELSKGGLVGEAIAKSTKGYAGQADIPRITPPKLTPKQWDMYSKKILEVYPVKQAKGVKDKFQFERTDTQKALNDLRAGKILTNSQYPKLVKILGADAAKEIYKSMQKFQPASEKKWQLLRDVVQLFKMKFAFDVQFFRQASSFAARHPIKYAKGGYMAVRSALSGKYAKQIDAQVENSPYYEDAKGRVNFISAEPWSEVGSKHAQAAEQYAFGRQMVEKLTKVGKKSKLPIRLATSPIRGAGRWLLAQERSMASSCNHFMLDLYETQVKKWEAKGITGDKLETYKNNYADTINTFIKIWRSKSPTGRRMQKAANYVLFSPSMTYTRIRRPVVLVKNKGSRAYAAGLIATEIGKIYAMSAISKLAGNYLAEKFGWKDEKGNPIITGELNPKSADWGKVKIRNVRYDLAGGDAQYYRTIAQLIGDFHSGQMKTQAGKIIDIPRIEIIERYLKSRETAFLGAMTELLTNRDFMGEKIFQAPDFDKEPKTGLGKAYQETGKFLTKTIPGKVGFVATKWLVKQFAPQMFEGMWEAALNDGWLQVLPVGITESASMAVQTYEDRTSTQLSKEQDYVAKEKYGKVWEDLNPQQQRVLQYENKQLAQLQREKKYDWEQRGEEKLEIRLGERLSKNLSSDIKEELKRNNVTVGHISRTIGKLKLNDERYELYQETLTEQLNKRLGYRIKQSDWPDMSIEKKQRVLDILIKQTKSLSQNKVMQQVYKETKK